MFLHFGNTYINTSQIKRITPKVRSDRGEWAEIEMIDGVTLEGHLSLSRIEALTMQVFPAPPGYETIDFVHGTSAEVRREKVVAFAFSSGWDCLTPITAESGLVEGTGLKNPSGEVHTSFESYSSEIEFIDAQGKAAA
jgi:hypothetical protein